MNITDILTTKRHAGCHTAAEIYDLVAGYVSGGVKDYQMSAWLMAVCINGMCPEETQALTEAMAASGETLDLSSVPGIKVDKHSTGGVGDKTTLVLAPLLASAGLVVAKMAGRGLGITGGTIDKLESIPGFTTKLTTARFKRQASDINCVVAGQSADLVPADKLIYALRDVTATVDSIPLIASSVMSKKLATGSQTILLDVKVGSGAFMKDLDSARDLAKLMVDIGTRADRRVIAVITPMDEPLGLAVGNAVEVAEAIDTLKGAGPSDLRGLCIELATLIYATALGFSLDESRETITRILDSGEALHRFADMVEAQGGNPDVVNDLAILPQPLFRHVLTAKASGFVQQADAGAIGRAAGALGAGRRAKDDEIDPSAGVLLRKKVGDRVEAGDELAVLIHSRESDDVLASTLVESAFVIGPDKVEPSPIILETIGFEPPTVGV